MMPHLLTVTLLLSALCSETWAQSLVSESAWKKLPPIPNAHGVAAPFAGVWKNSLIVAGGANFPEKLPWEGGQKIWHDSIYLLNAENSQWREIGKLSTPLAYGLTFSTPTGLVCVGGSNSEKHFASVFRLRYEQDEVTFENLPDLPKPVANACGAIIQNTIYVAGGIETPTATTALNVFYAMNLSQTPLQWEALATWPGAPRMLSVAGVLEDKFYLCSGVALTPDTANKPQRTYLRDCYCYTPGKSWQKIADLPQPTVAAPSPAIILDSKLCIFGGDAGTHVGFQPPERHPGFSNQMLSYDPEQNKWLTHTEELPAARVTVPLVQWNNAAIIPSGEQRPGIRSPEVWSYRLPR
jgi:N-acetylneuraminate epimerase